MSEFRIKSRSVQFNQFSETHSSVSAHFDHGASTSNTVVTASHHPKSARSEEFCPEYYNLTVRHSDQDRSSKRHVSDEISMFLTREDMERIHFATGELLAQSEGLEDGAASARVVCDPREEDNAGCDSCGTNDRAPDSNLCSECAK
jgi:hypothetical protein